MHAFLWVDTRIRALEVCLPKISTLHYGIIPRILKIQRVKGKNIHHKGAKNTKKKLLWFCLGVLCGLICLFVIWDDCANLYNPAGERQKHSPQRRKGHKEKAILVFTWRALRLGGLICLGLCLCGETLCQHS